MAIEIDIYRSAERLIEEHSEDAPIVAAMEADACAEAGDLDGKVVWLKVIEVIKVLQDTSIPSARTTIQ